MVNRYIPKYNDDSDYNTNAPSYYEDLARKQKLIELLSKKIWEYEEKLNLTLEDIEKRVAQRFNEWDLRIEKFPENVEDLLQEWLSDGTLDHIINDTIFSWKADQVDLDETNRQLEQTMTKITNIEIINILDFNIVGDGIADDTIVVQEAFNQAQGKKLIIPKTLNCRITSQILVPKNIVLQCDGVFTLDGDEDYWFHGTNSDVVVIENINTVMVVTYSSRLKENRTIRIEYPNYFEVKKCNIDGSSNCIHSLYGKMFVGGILTFTNIMGDSPQSGYGLNVSSKIINVNSIITKNDNSLNGRHSLYINGNIWEHVNINYVYTENFMRNPVQIFHESLDVDVNAYCNINTIDLVNCNIQPSTVNIGSIHLGEQNPSGVKIYIGEIRATNNHGCVLSMYGKNDGSQVGDIYVENVPSAFYANTHLVYVRSGKNKRVKNIYCSGLSTNWISALYVRDAENFMFDNLVVNGDNPTANALYLYLSSVIAGKITTKLNRIYNYESTIKYKNHTQTIDYKTTIPITGDWTRGDIVYNSAPSPSEFLGWVCTATGTPGTWKGFGIIEA